MRSILLDGQGGPRASGPSIRAPCDEKKSKWRNFQASAQDSAHTWHGACGTAFTGMLLTCELGHNDMRGAEEGVTTSYGRHMALHTAPSMEKCHNAKLSLKDENSVHMRKVQSGRQRDRKKQSLHFSLLHPTTATSFDFVCLLPLLMGVLDS